MWERSLWVLKKDKMTVSTTYMFRGMNHFQTSTKSLDLQCYGTFRLHCELGCELVDGRYVRTGRYVSVLCHHINSAWSTLSPCPGVHMTLICLQHFLGTSSITLLLKKQTSKNRQGDGTTLCGTYLEECGTWTLVGDIMMWSCCPWPSAWLRVQS